MWENVQEETVAGEFRQEEKEPSVLSGQASNLKEKICDMKQVGRWLREIGGKIWLQCIIICKYQT